MWLRCEVGELVGGSKAHHVEGRVRGLHQALELALVPWGRGVWLVRGVRSKHQKEGLAPVPGVPEPVDRDVAYDVGLVVGRWIPAGSIGMCAMRKRERERGDEAGKEGGMEGGREGYG